MAGLKMAEYFAYGSATVASAGIEGLAYAAYRGAGALVVRETAKRIESLIKVGNVMDRGGLTVVGRALQKHGNRTGSIFPKVTGNAAAINVQGERVLNRILTNSNVTSVTRHHVGLGNVLEYRIPGSQGARFSGDGKTFLGFLE